MTASQTGIGYRLAADFPSLFTHFGHPREVYTGNGWEGLLRWLSAALQTHHPGITYTGLKEKYGGLRVTISGTYTSDLGGGLDIGDLIDTAENDSYWTCETCGDDQGRMAETGGGWMFTSCQECLDMAAANGRGGQFDDSRRPSSRTGGCWSAYGRLGDGDGDAMNKV